MGNPKPLPPHPALSRPVLVGSEYPKLLTLVHAPGQQGFAVREMEWGFIPIYWKNREQADRFRMGYRHPSSGKWVQYLTLNARSESLLEPGKMFREAALQSRCLIPATGFFEWRQVFGKNKRTGAPLKTAKKYPYFISPPGESSEPGNQVFFFIAGIYQSWTDQETGETEDTLSIVTTEANELMRKIHNSRYRMPTILSREKADRWLDPDLEEEEVALLAKTKISGSSLIAYPIEKDFLNQDGPFPPASYPELPAL